MPNLETASRSARAESGRSLDERPEAALGRDDVVRICGDILDWKVTAIIATGASVAEVEAACAWAAGQDELGQERGPLAGKTAEVYDILMAGEEFDEEEA